MDIKRGTEEETRDFFFVFDKQKLVAVLDTRSQEEFEASIQQIKKNRREYAKKMSAFLLEHLHDEYFDLIPMLYLWALKNGYEESVGLFDSNILPKATPLMTVTEGKRWLLAFDSLMRSEDRFELIREWLGRERAISQQDRIERWMAIHGLFNAADETNGRLREKVKALYTDFMKQEENRDIERIFGEVIEADFVRMKKDKQHTASKGHGSKDDDATWFLDNWLMRRYALEEVLKKIPRLALSLGGLILWITAIVFSVVLSKNAYLPAGFYNYKMVFVLIFLVFFLGGWRILDGKLSKLVWGCIIGWLLILSEAIGNIVRAEYNYEDVPQILQLDWLEILLSSFLFLGTALFIMRWEIKGANLRRGKKKFQRISSIIFSGMYFSLLEGAIFICFLTWLFRQPYHCWFFKWDALLLAIGTPMALLIGIITQLVWESTRLTEIVRK